MPDAPSYSEEECLASTVVEVVVGLYVCSAEGGEGGEVAGETCAWLYWPRAPCDAAGQQRQCARQYKYLNHGTHALAACGVAFPHAEDQLHDGCQAHGCIDHACQLPFHEKGLRDGWVPKKLFK